MLSAVTLSRPLCLALSAVSSAARQNFFQFDSTQGSLRRNGTERIGAFSSEFVQMLHVTLVDQFADTAQDVLYRSGYDWGLREFVRLTPQFQRQLGAGADIRQAGAKAILDAWWEPIAEAGWGSCTFEPGSAGRGVAVAELRNSAVVAALGPSDQPICHLYAGLFASALSFIQRAERHCVEIECGALGAPTCQFIVAGGSEVDSAETWRQQGTAAAEIIRRLR